MDRAFSEPGKLNRQICAKKKIDTTRQIAQTLYFSLSGVDALQSKGLKCMFESIFDWKQPHFLSGVDSSPETRSV